MGNTCAITTVAARCSQAGLKSPQRLQPSACILPPHSGGHYRALPNYRSLSTQHPSHLPKALLCCHRALHLRSAPAASSSAL